MTYALLLQLFKDAAIPSPATDARLLLSHFFGVSPAEILAHPERDYTGDGFAAAVAQRMSRVPLQHILGEAYFYGNRFLISPDCLIPRADTELLVEEACRLLPKGAHFADFCTGSGCIALSVLSQRTDTTALGVDISPKALAVAQKNADALGLSTRVAWHTCDLLQTNLPHDAPRYILSNPPYIRDSVISTLEPELSHEPRIALCGGEDGLLFYRTLLSRFSPDLFLFEIGFDQGDAVAALGREKGYTATVKKDLGGCDRLVILSR